MPIGNIDSLVKIYQQEIDGLIESLGKPVEVITVDTISNISADHIDTVRNIPKKPSFKNDQPTRIENKIEIKALIKWNPKEVETFDINITQGKSVVRIKTYLRHVPDLKRAEYIIPNSDSKAVINSRFKLVQGPVPTGLSEDRYCVSYWEEI